MKACLVEGCPRPVHGRGWCSTHYRRWRVTGEVGGMESQHLVRGTCTVEGCDKPHMARGWCQMHYSRWLRKGRVNLPTPEERFWAKVDKNGPGGCWLWTGALDAKGYGMWKPAGRANSRSVKAHRWAYETLIGTVPDGLQLDHVCRVRNCVNPFGHLEPVTGRENLMRSPITLAAINVAKTHCIRGHEFTPENTRITTARSPHGERSCRACDRLKQREYRNRKLSYIRRRQQALDQAVAS